MRERVIWAKTDYTFNYITQICIVQPHACVNTYKKLLTHSQIFDLGPEHGLKLLQLTNVIGPSAQKGSVRHSGDADN